MKKKIKFVSNFDSTEHLNYVVTKFFVPKEDLNHYEFVTTGEDYTVVFGNCMNWEKYVEAPKERTIFMSHEPLWNLSNAKGGVEKFSHKNFISDKRSYPNTDEFIETLTPFWYTPHTEVSLLWDNTDNVFNKTKNISMLPGSDHRDTYSNLSNPPITRIIYKERAELADNLKRDLKFIYFSERHVYSKYEVLQDFKFSIVCENTVQKNYISEKFWDCILVDTVPIYIGCNNIHDYIDEDVFINLTDKIDDYKYIVNKLNYINENCDELYQKYLPKIKNLKNQFKTDPRFNLWEFIKKELSS